MDSSILQLCTCLHSRVSRYSKWWNWYEWHTGINGLPIWTVWRYELCTGMNGVLVGREYRYEGQRHIAMNGVLVCTVYRYERCTGMNGIPLETYVYLVWSSLTASTSNWALEPASSNSEWACRLLYTTLSSLNAFGVCIKQLILEQFLIIRDGYRRGRGLGDIHRGGFRAGGHRGVAPPHVIFSSSFYPSMDLRYVDQFLMSLTLLKGIL